MPSHGTGTLIFLDCAGTAKRQQLVLAAGRPIAWLARALGATARAYRVKIESSLVTSERDITPVELLEEGTLREVRLAAFERVMRDVRTGEPPWMYGAVAGDAHAVDAVSTLADVAEAAHFASRATRRAGVSRAIVVSTSRWRGRYIVEHLRREGIRAHALTLPDGAPDIVTRSTGATRVMHYELAPELEADETPDVLLVAESTPMFGTLLPVARRLREVHGRRVALVRSTMREATGTQARKRPRPDPTIGRDSGDPADQALAAIGRELWNRQVHEVERSQPNAEALLERYRPKLLVVANDRFWSGQLLVRAARRRQVPSLCVQDGLAVDIPLWWFRTADYTAANGTFLRDVLVRFGVPADTVFVTGQPRMDAMHDRLTRLDRAAARATLGLPEDTRYVLLALQDDHTGEYVARALDGLARVAGIRILVRPHHWQNRRVLDEVVEAAIRKGAPATLRTGDDIGTLLRAVDVVVSQYSTVLVEAALMGTPGISLTLSGGLNALDLVREGIALGARSEAELATVTARALAMDGRALDAVRDHAEALVGPFDGRSTERVAALVDELLRTSGTGASRSSGARHLDPSASTAG